MIESTYGVLLPFSSPLSELIVLAEIDSTSFVPFRIKFFRFRWIERKANHALRSATMKDGNPIPMPTPKLILFD
jgi:hypothetical protein